MEKDILEILENKSDEPFISSSKKLIKKLSKEATKEEILKAKEEVKKAISELLETKFLRVKEIYNNGKIDSEKLEFAIKLINNDEEIFKQIEEIKGKKEKEKKIKDLAEIKEHVQNTINNLRVKIEKISISNQNKEKPSLIKKIIGKDKVKDEQEVQLEEIIKVIEESKSIPENKELKESYLIKENIHGTIDMLYKKCKTKDVEEFKEIGVTLQKQYKQVIEDIDYDLNKLKNQATQQKKYDERLVEYVYDKPKNYISQSIDNSRKNPMFRHLLTILKLIDEIEKTEEKEKPKIKNVKIFNKNFKNQKFKIEKEDLQRIKENIKHKNIN